MNDENKYPQQDQQSVEQPNQAAPQQPVAQVVPTPAEQTAMPPTQPGSASAFATNNSSDIQSVISNKIANVLTSNPYVAPALGLLCFVLGFVVYSPLFWGAVMLFALGIAGAFTVPKGALQKILLVICAVMTIVSLGIVVVRTFMGDKDLQCDGTDINGSYSYHEAKKCYK
jgi:hypothetical protein